MEKISKTQIDQLGNRLRKAFLSEADLKMLNEYRKSFSMAYEEVVRAIREKLNLEPTGRPAKSTSSIIEKLHRESIRLSQVQDIAGCRVVVADIKKQDYVVEKLCDIFPSALVIDRRMHPSYGYQAVHVVIKIFAKVIEVQIRTELQHGWSELSEKFSDKIDSAIKYGGGYKKAIELLCNLSSLIKNYEELEKQIFYFPKKDMPSKKMIDIKMKITVLIKKYITEEEKL